MSVAVAFCAQPKCERRENEKHHALFGGSEKEFLPDLIEFGKPALFNHE